MPAHRQLRPDAALYLRLAAGESVRVVAADYGVAHTTLGRHLRTPEGSAALAAALASPEAPSEPVSANVPPSAPEVGQPAADPEAQPVSTRTAFGPIRGFRGEEVVFVFPLERAPEVLGFRTLEGTGTGAPIDGARSMLRVMAEAGDLVLEPGAAEHVLTYPVRHAAGRERLVVVRGCEQRLQVERLARARRYDARGSRRTEGSALFPAAQLTGNWNPLRG